MGQRPGSADPLSRVEEGKRIYIYIYNYIYIFFYLFIYLFQGKAGISQMKLLRPIIKKETDRQTDRQTDRPTDRHTDRVLSLKS